MGNRHFLVIHLKPFVFDLNVDVVMTSVQTANMMDNGKDLILHNFITGTLFNLEAFLKLNLPFILLIIIISFDKS